MRFNVAVIGAGPAGATTALHLARAGAAVCIVERRVFPRTKACGEYLSGGSVQTLEGLGVASALTPHARELQGIRFFGNGTQAELPFSVPAWSLPRADLDMALLQAAVSAGAVHMTGRASSFVDKNDGVQFEIFLPRGESQFVRASILVGADGAHSLVARSFGLTQRSGAAQRFAVGGHYGDLRRNGDCVEMFVDGRSYLAVNPLRHGRANVMFIVGKSRLANRHGDLDALIRERAGALCRDRLDFTPAHPDGKRIAIGPLEYRAARYTARHVLLVGDAAHFLDPFTGQGVFIALRGAELAARAILRQFAQPASDTFWRRSYEAELRALVSRRSRLSAMVGALVRSPALAKSLRRGHRSPSARLYAAARCSQRCRIMQMRNAIVIQAPAQTIYARAADTERWPQVLPHYRFVRVLGREGEVRSIEMAAFRDVDALHVRIPVRWRAQQINDAKTPSIRFRHVAGWTTGMQVLWSFEERDGATLVTIDHRWNSPLARSIGRLFVDPIATRTLRTFKAISENAR